LHVQVVDTVSILPPFLSFVPGGGWKDYSMRFWGNSWTDF